MPVKVPDNATEHVMSSPPKYIQNGLVSPRVGQLNGRMSCQFKGQVQPSSPEMFTFADNATTFKCGAP